MTMLLLSTTFDFALKPRSRLDVLHTTNISRKREERIDVQSNFVTHVRLLASAGRLQKNDCHGQQTLKNFQATSSF